MGNKALSCVYVTCTDEVVYVTPTNEFVYVTHTDEVDLERCNLDLRFCLLRNSLSSTTFGGDKHCPFTARHSGRVIHQK